MPRAKATSRNNPTPKPQNPTLKTLSVGTSLVVFTFSRAGCTMRSHRLLSAMTMQEAAAALSDGAVTAKDLLGVRVDRCSVPLATLFFII